MAKVAKEVSVAITGAVYKVPSSVDITAVDSALTTAVEYGYISEDRVELSNNASLDEITAWQNSTIVRRVGTDENVTITFTLIQNTKDARELYFGSTESASGKIEWKPGAKVRGKFVIDYIDSGYGDDDEVLMGRYVFNDAQVTEVESITLTSTDAIGYGVTLTAYTDESGKVGDIFTEVKTLGGE